jgi:peptidoglycan/LPS O-acetylase OafA/YrhL
MFLELRRHFGFHQAAAYVFILTVTVGFIASWLMARFIDAPGINFSKYVYTRFFKKSEAA